MKILVLIVILFFILTIKLVYSADYSTGSSPLEFDVNPCSIFTNETSCLKYACTWCGSYCVDRDCPLSNRGIFVYRVYDKVVFELRIEVKKAEQYGVEGSLFVKNEGKSIIEDLQIITYILKDGTLLPSTKSTQLKLAPNIGETITIPIEKKVMLDEGKNYELVAEVKIDDYCGNISDNFEIGPLLIKEPIKPEKESIWPLFLCPILVISTFIGSRVCVGKKKKALIEGRTKDMNNSIMYSKLLLGLTLIFVIIGGFVMWLWLF